MFRMKSGWKLFLVGVVVDGKTGIDPLTRGYSTQSETKIFCMAVGLKNIILSIPNGPTARTTGPYSFAHWRCRMPASARMMSGNSPNRTYLNDFGDVEGPGAFRMGER